MGDEDEPPAASRRVGAMHNTIADVIRVKSVFAKKTGRAPQAKCTRKIAKEIIGDPDRKHARRLKSFEATAKNDAYGQEKSSRGIAEAYSPPRMTLVAREFGLKPRWSLDLTTVDRDDGEA